MNLGPDSNPTDSLAAPDEPASNGSFDNAATDRERRVILLVEPTSAYGRGCLRGIARYARGHGHWTFHHRTRYLMEPLNVKAMAAWGAHGIIARIENKRMAAVIRKLDL